MQLKHIYTAEIESAMILSKVYDTIKYFYCRYLVLVLQRGSENRRLSCTPEKALGLWSGGDAKQ